MKISTRSRYGVRLMQDLALKYGNGLVYLKDIAREEEISEKYLSLIIIPLKAAGLVKATRGAHGGYALARPPAEITLKDIVEVLEGDVCLVDCLKDPSICRRRENCASRDVWSTVTAKMVEVLDSFTLESLSRLGQEKAQQSIMYHI